MAISTKTILGVGMAGAIIAAVFMASKQSKAPVAEMAAPVTLAQANAASQAAGPATASNAPAPQKKLLFFMNPYGYPCQTQLGILNSVSDSLGKVAQVVYVKTTVPADMQTFEAYGIRALPSLVITDQSGRELSRFSPGIQSGEAVLAALTK